MIPAITSRLGVGLALVSALSAPVLGQLTARVSVGTGGTQGNHDSYGPSLSANGRYVAFFSKASNLVPGDTYGADDVFLHDRRTGTTIRVSVDPAGLGGNGNSYSPVLSATGRYVAYYSEASNLVSGDTNGTRDRTGGTRDRTGQHEYTYDVFLYDVITGITERVSVDSNGVEGNDSSLYPSISGDARFVTFSSLATNLVAEDGNGEIDVFLHDRATGATTLVSVDSSGAQGNKASQYPTISADGTRIAFESKASNLTPGDTNNSFDIFLRDLVQGTTTCVSVDASGVPGNGGCSYASISGNGRSVAFASWSTNLVDGDLNGLTDVFVHDVEMGRTTLISVSSEGLQGDGISQVHSLAACSYDGRFVAFKSYADNLVPYGSSQYQDIFLRDRLLGTTTLMSLGLQDQAAAGTCSQPVISSNGRQLGFYSHADNLVPGDTNGVPDVFVRPLP